MLRVWHFRFAPALLVSTLLAGCGGGGGGGSSAPGPVTSTLSFPLQSAHNAFVAGGVTRSFTVSITAVSGASTVTCSGTGTLAASPATTAATFEGKPALSALSTVTITTSASPGCNAATITTTLTDYYDSNFVALGHNTVGGDYGVFLTAPSLPTSAKVGDAGILGTETLYTNSTKTTSVGTSAVTFALEADTANTAIVNVKSTDSDATGKVILTTQSRYRIADVGAVTPISVDAQFTNGDRLTIQYL